MMRSLALLAVIAASTLGASLALVDVCTVTTVDVEASGCDPSTSDDVCGLDCKAGLDWDPRLSTSRWSCKWGIFASSEDDDGCWIRYSFEEPQDIGELRITFYKGNGNAHTLKVYVDGHYHSKIKASESTNGYQTFDLVTDETEELGLAFDHDGDVWFSITKVNIMVE